MELTNETLSLVRSLASRMPQCCEPNDKPCDKCLVIRAVDDLVLEVERHRWGLPPPVISVAVPEAYTDLATCARALVDALGTQPMTEPVLVARSYVVEALEEIEARQRDGLIRS